MLVADFSYGIKYVLALHAVCTLPLNRCLLGKVLKERLTNSSRLAKSCWCHIALSFALVINMNVIILTADMDMPIFCCPIRIGERDSDGFHLTSNVHISCNEILNNTCHCRADDILSRRSHLTSLSSTLKAQGGFSYPIVLY